MALTHGGIHLPGRAELSESALTQLWLEKGYAELVESEQREPWRQQLTGGVPQPPVTQEGNVAETPPAPAPVTPKRRRRINTFSRQQELHDLAERMRHRGKR
jgi:hypothetical protein